MSSSRSRMTSNLFGTPRNLSKKGIPLLPPAKTEEVSHQSVLVHKVDFLELQQKSLTNESRERAQTTLDMKERTDAMYAEMQTISAVTKYPLSVMKRHSAGAEKVESGDLETIGKKGERLHLVYPMQKNTETNAEGCQVTKYYMRCKRVDAWSGQLRHVWVCIYQENKEGRITRHVGEFSLA